MSNKVNKDDPRTFMYLGKELKTELAEFATIDPRFESVSECARFLIKLGMETDIKNREKPLKAVN